MSASKLSGKPDEMLRVTLQWISIQSSNLIPLFTDKLK